MITIRVLTVSILVSTCFCASLRFYGANQQGGIANWKRSKGVRSKNFTICPDGLPDPFTLVCIPKRPASSAEFFIDGSLTKVERVMPFTITGDFGGIARPWNPPPTVGVECRLDTGEKVRTTIHFRCSGSGSTESSDSTPTVAAPTRPPRPPSFQPGSGSVPSSSGGGVPTSTCVRIPALAYESADLGASAWQRKGSALFYKPNDGDTETTRDANTAVATYKFKAPTTSTYGITLDMETAGVVDHNDIWLLFEPDGFVLQRGKSTKTSKGWTKAYHNRNGRYNQVFSVDFDPHSFSTRLTLVKGAEYTVKVGGRSTKTGFYSIILFPCNRREGQCDGTRGNGHWTASRDKCT